MRRHGIAGSAIIATAALAASGLTAASAAAAPTTTTRAVVMTNATGRAQSLLGPAHGRLVSDLPLISGVIADLPADQLSALAKVPGVVVTPNVPLSLADAGTASTAAARRPAAVFPDVTGATRLGSQGITGLGVNVAVLDTGIDRLPDFTGRLVDGVDLSGEGNAFRDSYGHGTFVAGLIAGNGASSNGLYRGEAPGAGLISVKVAGASGVTDMATVIAGISWVVANRAADHIGVLNISLGAVPVASTVLNPLDRAVEAAWRSGVTVVTSAGNSGPFNGTILSPGDDPLVITAGAFDDNGTIGRTDDTMTAFSSVGPTNRDGWFKPDLIAPGRSLVSLRAPGSTIDSSFASARVGTGNFVGSGTSFSAGVVSGAAALVLQSAPTPWKPDVVKARLLASTGAGPVGNPFVDGHGTLNAFQASAMAPVGLDQEIPLLPTPAGATVSLKASWLASPWNGTAWNGTAWNGTAWN